MALPESNGCEEGGKEGGRGERNKDKGEETIASPR